MAAHPADITNRPEYISEFSETFPCNGRYLVRGGHMQFGRIVFLLISAILIGGLSVVVAGQLEVSAAIKRFEAEMGPVDVELNRSTGTARLLRFSNKAAPEKGMTLTTQAEDLFLRHGAVFGITNAGQELVADQVQVDNFGSSHQSFRQYYEGVPVFGGVLRVHADRSGRLTAMNGVFIPKIAPLRSVADIQATAAEAIAVALVAKRLGESRSVSLSAQPATKYVYRSNLTRGIEGASHLVWEVEVRDRTRRLENVYIDAHSGRLVDRIDAVHNLVRAIAEKSEENVVWTEGDPLPYSGSGIQEDQEINVMIEASADVHSVFANLSGGEYQSWDGSDGIMYGLYDLGALDDEICPNAIADLIPGFGAITAFCIGIVSDDVVAHEWAHNYTAANHGLIYAWQSGALNEAYSDIFGEVTDRLNGEGSDSPGQPRLDGECSTVGGSLPPALELLSPVSVAGDYDVGGAGFNPLPPWSVEGIVELVDDGTNNPSQGCADLQSFTSGRIALVDRGDCDFSAKVAFAETAGAAAVIVVNDSDDILSMGSGETRLGIPAVLVGASNGEAIKAVLGEGVTAKLTGAAPSDDSLRWLIGEDTAVWGAIRDMWNPVCFGDPGKVSDVTYHCSEDDGGGVHSNSGVPNHAFALITDGGTYNDTTVTGIGLTKAAHIYWRAMSVYQVPSSGFEDHADLITLSCEDLVGASLIDLGTGDPAVDTITAIDCAQVASVMEAVEMRLQPTQCGFQPVLEPNPPAVEHTHEILNEGFDSDPAGIWLLSNEAGSSSYNPRDWRWTSTVPDGGDGAAFYAVDETAEVGNCSTIDESGVMHLDSPEIRIPQGVTAATLSFDHYVATEPTWDGGNLKLKINGGDFVLVPADAFLHNPYNSVLVASGSNNPLGGEIAFSGTNEGSNEGSWGQSQVDLLQLANPGDTVQLRFDFGVDWCNGVHGWYVDNVQVFAKIAEPRRGGNRVGN